MADNIVVLVGSRASALAKAQVREVLAPLRRQLPHVDFRHRVILEGGDRDRRTPTLAEVAKSSGGSAFSSSQEAALLAGEVDVIVHSLKDLPTAMLAGLMLLTTPGPRAGVRDALCGHSLASLPHGARVGTGAPRRVAQLLALRPDLTLVPIRGNVGPRLARITTGSMDAVLLAAAGLQRLGLEEHVAQYLDPQEFLPSPGQGALGRLGTRVAPCRDLVSQLRSTQRHGEGPVGKSLPAEERADVHRNGQHRRLSPGLSPATGRQDAPDASAALRKQLLLRRHGVSGITRKAASGVRPDRLPERRAHRRAVHRAENREGLQRRHRLHAQPEAAAQKPLQENIRVGPAGLVEPLHQGVEQTVHRRIVEPDHHQLVPTCFVQPDGVGVRSATPVSKHRLHDVPVRDDDPLRAERIARHPVEGG